MNQVYTYALSLDWKLINTLSAIDRFGGSWLAIERTEGQSLKELKSIATVRSVGASTRIEGSKMTDAEVEVLLSNLSVAKLEERDQQEVVGYFETLDVISESYRNIDISENNLKMLHSILMKRSEKDKWHKGDYKQHSNVVEATQPDGTKYTVFQPTDPGYATEDAIRQLIQWYNADLTAHPLVRASLFIYDFLSVHPFQDGNGRLSRLLATLLLLKNGYSWIQYVSFEHEIENRKSEYYRVLMECQRQRPGEDVYPWAIFFLECLIRIQEQLMSKLKAHQNVGASSLSMREKKVRAFIEANPGTRSGLIAERLAIPLPTIKRLLADMVEKRLLVKHGIGKGTNYSVYNSREVESDRIFKLTDSNRKKEFLLVHSDSMIEIKKLVLTPLFEWKVPKDWGSKLIEEDLSFIVKARTASDSLIELPTFSITGLIDPNFFNPVFTLPGSIRMPDWHRQLRTTDYPVIVSIDLFSRKNTMSFEVDFVYDALLD